MTSSNPIVIDDEVMEGELNSYSEVGTMGGPSLRMTSDNPIVLDEEAVERPLNSFSDIGRVSGQASKMTSDNPVVLDEEAMERPLYTGIQQWAAMRQVTDQGSTFNPIRTPGMPGPSSASKRPAPPNPQPRKVSAYHHIAVSPPHPLDLPRSQIQPLNWEVPPQPVCKDGAKPTAVCGRYSAALNDPPIRPARGGRGPYKCPRCRHGFTRIDTVRQHFPLCIALNGNPDCDSWTDDHSYGAGAANRRAHTASRVHGGVPGRARRAPTNAARLVTLGISELIVRIAAHPEWVFNGLEPPDGEKPPVIKTEEEEDDAWMRLVKNQRDDTRDATGEIAPEMEALIATFKEEGKWDSDDSDEA